MALNYHDEEQLFQWIEDISQSLNSIASSLIELVNRDKPED